MKKKKNKIDKQYNGEEVQLAKVKWIALGIILFFALAYFIGALITGKISFKKEEKAATTIQYEEILAEMTFKQPEAEYFVLYYSFSSSDSSMINNYASKLEGTAPVYKVDLGKGFNTGYIADGDTKTPTSINDLKVKDPTLIRVKNKKAISYVNGLNNIKTYVSKL